MPQQLLLRSHLVRSQEGQLAQHGPEVSPGHVPHAHHAAQREIIKHAHRPLSGSINQSVLVRVKEKGMVRRATHSHMQSSTPGERPKVTCSAASNAAHGAQQAPRCQTATTHHTILGAVNSPGLAFPQTTHVAPCFFTATFPAPARPLTRLRPR